LFFTYLSEVEKFAVHISKRLPLTEAPSRRQSSTAFILIYAVIIGLSFVVFETTNIPSWLSQLVQLHIPYQLDSLTLTLVVALILAIFHSVKQSRERATMKQARERAEYDLAESMVRTETERALRLGRRPAWDLRSDRSSACETNLMAVIEAMRNLGTLLQNKFGLEGENAKALDNIFSSVVGNLQISMRNACDLSRSGAGPINDVAIDNRRQYFLLRLLTARVAPFFRQDNSGETTISREFVVGFDLFLRHTFGDTMYELLNEEAAKIMRALPSDVDSQLWLHLMADERYRNFGLRLLTKLQTAFDDFSRGRSHFMTIVGKHRGGGISASGLSKEFADREFATIFSALFGDLWEFAETEENRAWLDYLCGAGASDSVRQTYMNFSLSIMALMPESDAQELLLSEGSAIH